MIIWREPFTPVIVALSWALHFLVSKQLLKTGNHSLKNERSVNNLGSLRVCWHLNPCKNVNDDPTCMLTVPPPEAVEGNKQHSWRCGREVSVSATSECSDQNEWQASQAVFCKNCRGKVLKQCAAGSIVKVHRKKGEEKLLQELKQIGKEKENENTQVWKKKTQSMKIFKQVLGLYQCRQGVFSLDSKTKRKKFSTY